MTIIKKSTFLTFFALILLPISTVSAQTDNPIKRLVANDSKAINYSPYFPDDMTAFYKDRNYQLVWFDQDGSENVDIEDVQGLVREHALQNGLAPDDYNFSKIAQTGDTYAKDVMMSAVIMHYLNDIRSGRINPENFDSQIFTLPEQQKLDEKLSGFMNSGDYEDYLEASIPPQDEYKVLRSSLATFQEAAKNGGWDKMDMPDDAVVYPNETHEKISEIKKRLDHDLFQYDGELPGTAIWIDDARIDNEDLEKAESKQSESENEKSQANQNPDHIYTQDLARKVQEFQYLHGLKADGVIGPETIAAMKKPIGDYVDRIKLSMERWRWMPEDLGDKHIRLNIAGFYARAVDNGQDQFVMPIIVGQVAHQTPIFSSIIKNVKIHPDWTSPDSIAERYLIPKIQNNPSVVYEKGYQAISKRTGEIVPWSEISIPYLNTRDFRFRQKPGENNALGLARFSIENDYAIFMHGTPKVNLFEKGERTFSSGCIRLEDPLKMAKYLLNGQSMSAQELEDLYYLTPEETAKTEYIDLDKDVPVHLLYLTAWVDNGNQLHFAEDVYGRDEDLKQALVKLN